MKTKIICVFVFSLLVQIANAQTFGIKGGINFSNVTVKMGGASMSPKSLTGYHIGVVADYDLKQNLYFNTGLLYSLKGYSAVVSGPSDGPITLKEKLNYLEVPLNLAYKFPIKENKKFFLQAGPYLAYGIGVREMYGSVSTNSSFSDSGVKSFDYGLGLGGGLECGALVASINYQLGLADMNDASDVVDANMKNKVFQISLAYMFQRK